MKKQLRRISLLLIIMMLVLQIANIKPLAYENSIKVSNELNLSIEQKNDETINETTEESIDGEVNNEEGTAEEANENTEVNEDGNVVNDANDNESLEQYSGISSAIVPENLEILESIYDEIHEESILSYELTEDDKEKKVLLVQDTLPWNTNSNVQVLNSLGLSYDIVQTNTFVTKDLSEYGVVIFANDQQFDAYSNYVSFKEYMELFAKSGGVIIFGACDSGWANGVMNSQLPGNVQKDHHYANNNYIVDKNHPIVTGELIDNVALKDEELHENYTSHSYFIESTLPVGSKVILRDSDLKTPTLVEYPLENGRVIASGLTWEFNYYYGGSGDRGTYSKTAMADLFLYAVRVSSIDVHDVSKLKEYYLNKNEHAIVVADKNTRDPLKNITVKVNGTKYTTDENGMVKCIGNGVETLVTIEGEGYRKSELIYNMKPGKSRFFFLEEDKNDGLPYITMVLESNREYDLKNQTMYLSKDDNEMCTIKIRGDWKDYSPDRYEIYQEGKLGGNAGKKVIVNAFNGEITFSPANTFNANEPVKIKMITKNGITSNPITIGLDIDEADKIIEDDDGFSGLLNAKYFRLGKGNSAKINDDKITSIFPGDYNLKFSSLPINVAYKKNINDGSYSLRATIGIGSSNYLEDDAKWQTFIKDFEKGSKNLDRLDRLAGLMQAFDEQLGIGHFTVTNKLKPEYTVLGYYEEKYDVNDKLISNGGGIVVSAGVKKTFSEQFLLGPVPMYFDLTGKLNLNVTNGLKYNHDSDEWNYSGKIDFVPSFVVGGGLGIKGVVTGGIEGEAKCTIQVSPTAKGTLTPTARVTAYLCFVFDYKYTIKTKDIPLWGEDNKAIIRMNEEELSNFDFEFMSREYNSSTTEWNGNTNISLFSNDEEQLYNLQEWILPSSIPEIEHVGDKQVMVFQADDKNSDDGNNVVLMYSVYDNGIWSEPKQVCDSGSSDLFSNLVEIDDELYLVWQKQKEDIKETDVNKILEEVCKKSEVCYAKWDKDLEKFVDIQYLTDNNSLDMLPRIGKYNGNLAAVWVNSDDSNPFGKSGNYTIMLSEMKNNKWQAAKEIYTTTNFITELVLDDNSNIGFIASDATAIVKPSEDEEDSNVVNDSEVYFYNGKEIICLTDNEVEESSLKIVDNKIYWSNEGTVEEYDIEDGSFETITAGGENIINSSFNVVELDNKKSILWIDSNESNSNLMATILTDKGWSNEIELLNSNEYIIRSFDTVISEDGKWQFIMNTGKTVDDDVMTSLSYVEIEGKNDIALDYVIANDNDRVNGVQPIDLNISNLGQEVVENLTLKVASESNTYLEKEISVDLQPGQAIVVSEEFDLSEINSKTDIKVLVEADNEESYENNEAIVTLGNIDVSLDIDRYENGDNVVIIANVANASNTPADVAISILDNDENGIVLDMKNIGTLDSNQQYAYVYSIDKNNIDFKEDGTKNYYIKIDTNEEDLYEDDNHSTVIVYEPMEVLPSDKPIEEVEIINVTGIEVSKESIELILDQEELLTEQLSANVYPENASFKNVVWRSNDSSIAVVNRNGLVTAVSKGETVITVETVDGNFIKEIKVKVLETKKEDTGDDKPGIDGDGDNGGNGGNGGNNGDGNGNQSGGDGENGEDNNDDSDGDREPGEGGTDNDIPVVGVKPNGNKPSGDSGKDNDKPIESIPQTGGVNSYILILLSIGMIVCGIRKYKVRKYK